MSPSTEARVDDSSREREAQKVQRSGADNLRGRRAVPEQQGSNPESSDYPQDIAQQQGVMSLKQCWKLVSESCRLTPKYREFHWSREENDGA